MKLMVVLLVLFVSSLAGANPSPAFPAWVTDSVVKQWAVTGLMEAMKDDDFYKIQSFKVNRTYDDANKTDVLEVKLSFDDPNCSGREVAVNAWANVCSDEGCAIFVGVSDCLPPASKSKIYKFMKKSKLVVSD